MRMIADEMMTPQAATKLFAWRKYSHFWQSVLRKLKCKKHYKVFLSYDEGCANLGKRRNCFKIVVIFWSDINCSSEPKLLEDSKNSVAETTWGRRGLWECWEEGILLHNYRGIVVFEVAYCLKSWTAFPTCIDWESSLPLVITLSYIILIPL